MAKNIKTLFYQAIKKWRRAKLGRLILKYDPWGIV